MVGASVQVLLPGPLVLDGHQLIEIGAAVDDALLIHAHAGRGLAHQGGELGRLVLARKDDLRGRILRPRNRSLGGSRYRCSQCDIGTRVFFIIPAY